MIKQVKNFNRNQRGQTLVELALILPILIILLMGTIEFGRIFFTYLTVTHASREAARSTVIATGKDDAYIRNKVLEAASWLTPADLKVDVTPSSPDNRTSGVPLTVTVSYPVQLYTPVLSNVLTNPFTVKAQTTMRIE
ncbi:TadE family protein [Desulfotomaculum nigrificans CO-1-SRB]|uniref:TadE family protein n=1 Tax=Desulfotomaculum nigrificans (strain DSM 14880 / VKM B-2319 / CO-1-SRB) TaxID=868595 RepID=F6B3M2_DESCC|nr:TadE/TadG family type IV pilus assembly protein [Desulfotomaculum nigrificans]AEF94051.1 TadE family protein [Desulfotomaculum nigrificans CO-1-SRB]